MNNEKIKAAEEPLLSFLDEAKHALAITWNEEDKDIERLLNRSVHAINELVGVELDYDINLSAREIVIERVRYGYNNALDEFENNYRQPLSRLILNVAIDERKKAENGNQTIPENI